MKKNLMNKNFVLAIVTILGLILAILIAILRLKILKSIFVPKKYEYYTFSDVRGISDYCNSKNRVECEINGVMVEVKQYSEVK